MVYCVFLAFKNSQNACKKMKCDTASILRVKIIKIGRKSPLFEEALDFIGF